MKKSFINNGYFLGVFLIAWKLLLLSDVAALLFPACLSNWTKLRRRSGHQFYAHEKVTNEVGGPRPQYICRWIQLSSSCVFALQ